MFAAAAVGAGLVRTVATTYLPVLLAEVKQAPGLIGSVMIVNSLAGFAVPLAVGFWSDRRHTVRHGRRPSSRAAACSPRSAWRRCRSGTARRSSCSRWPGSSPTSASTSSRPPTGRSSTTASGRAARTRGNGAQEVRDARGALLGSSSAALLTELATWAPFVLAAVAMPLLAWPTLRCVPVPVLTGEVDRTAGSPAGSVLPATMVRPGVRAMLAAEILWVLGYASLPVFFILYAKNVLGLGTGVASLWLAAFAVASGVAMGCPAACAVRACTSRCSRGRRAHGSGLPGDRRLDEPRAQSPSPWCPRLSGSASSRRSATRCSPRSSRGAKRAATRRCTSRCGRPRRRSRCRRRLDDRRDGQLPLDVRARRRRDAGRARAASVRPQSGAGGDVARAPRLSLDPPTCVTTGRSAGPAGRGRVTGRAEARPAAPRRGAHRPGGGPEGATTRTGSGLASPSGPHRPRRSVDPG